LHHFFQNRIYFLTSVEFSNKTSTIELPNRRFLPTHCLSVGLVGLRWAKTVSPSQQLDLQPEARVHWFLARTEKTTMQVKGVDNSYVSRMVNLTTLAPDIVEAILEDALPDHLTLFDLAVDPPALWEEQRLRIW